jgi:hypothetical protein
VAATAETSGIPDVIDAVTQQSYAVDELMTSEDMVEGLTALAAKRAPRWRNRLDALAQPDSGRPKPSGPRRRRRPRRDCREES